MKSTVLLSCNNSCESIIEMASTTDSNDILSNTTPSGDYEHPRLPLDSTVRGHLSWVAAVICMLALFGLILLLIYVMSARRRKGRHVKTRARRNNNKQTSLIDASAMANKQYGTVPIAIV